MRRILHDVEAGPSHLGGAAPHSQQQTNDITKEEIEESEDLIQRMVSII